MYVNLEHDQNIKFIGNWLFYKKHVAGRY